MTKWNDGRHRDAMPMDEQLPELVRLLDDNHVVIVEAETGAGKTTRICQYVAIMRAGAKVIVTQPRRAAVRWNAKRVAQEMGSRLGERVGYILSRDNGPGPGSRITFRVDQSLLGWVIANGRLPEGVLIIDEAHERSVELDLLLGLVKLYLPASPKTRVIVTSATIDTQKFSAFFDGAPVLSVKGRMFPVETPGVIRLAQYEHHSEAAVRGAKAVLRRFKEGSLSLPPAAEGGSRTKVRRGTVLVLLPGKEDIVNAISQLRREAEEIGLAESEVQILSCHGESAEAEQDAVQAPLGDGVLRIVCGTEILRTGVTVRETVGVVDSLEVKRMVTNERGVGRLAKVTISRAQADQAKGRAGRTQPGFYYPVSFGNEYESLAPYPRVAILSEPITKVVLRIAAVGGNARTFPLIDRPEMGRLELAVARLKKLGALDEQEKITPLGQRLVEIPLEPERSRSLVAAGDLGVLSEGAIAVGALEEEGFFQLQRSENGDRYDARDALAKARRSFAGDSASDFVALVRAYRAYKVESRRVRDDESLSRREREDALFAWARANSLNLKRLRLADEAIAELRECLEGSELELNGLAREREFDHEALTKALAAGHVDNVARSVGESKYACAASGFILGSESACSSSASLVLVEGFRKVVGRRGRELVFGQHAAPLKLEWLAEVMPQLCSRKRQGDHRYDPVADEVRETVILFYGEFRVAAQSVPSPAEDATAVFARHVASAWESKDSALTAVLRSNQERRSKAAELNRRAGEILFPHESSSGETVEFMRAALAGAGRVADVRDPEALRLPALDAELVARVECDNPAEITLLGEPRQVDYHSRPPRVSLPRSVFDSGAWRDLPDHVRLPGGREIAVEVQSGDWSSDRVCGETSEALKAVLVARELRARGQVFAEKLRQLRETHRVPYSRDGWSDKLESAARKNLFDGSLSESVPFTDVEGWMARVTAACDAAERSAAGHEARQAAMQAAEERGEILRDFRVYCRRSGSQQGDGWVIAPDGSLRDPDEVDNDHPSGLRYSHSIWRVVKADELALSWREREYRVDHRPVNEVTAAQLAAVKLIEKEIGALKGAFGLDSEATKQAAERLEAIRAVAARVLGEENVPDFDYLTVAGANGVYAESACLRVIPGKPFDERCDNRDAQVVRAERAADGVVEFLAYDKYGQMNFAMRWRPLREGEEFPTSAPSSGTPLSAEKVGSSKDKLRKAAREPTAQPAPWGTSEPPKKASMPEGVDPDSPFAKLAALRKQMSGK